MQQSFATQSLQLSFWSLRKIVGCSHSSSQCLVSTVFGTVSSIHPTSFLIFMLVILTFSNSSNSDRLTSNIPSIVDMSVVTLMR